MSEDRFQLLRLLEATLFATSEPMAEKSLAERLPEGADIAGLLQELAGLYANRGVHLLQIGERWAFRTAPDLGDRLQIETTVARKLSRAAIETLAIIAYHQPVTRAEVEEIRGVALSRGTLDTLLEAGWIRPKGRRQTPGRPVTWVTTEAFLDHFGLESREALPGIEELQGRGPARCPLGHLDPRRPGHGRRRAPRRCGRDGRGRGRGRGRAPEGMDPEAAAEFESMVAAAEAIAEEEDEEEPGKG